MTDAPNITRWKRRWFAVGCSHGHLIDWDFAHKVIAARREFNPHVCLHLGDWNDLSAFMKDNLTNAVQNHDTSGDLSAGVQFLEMLEPSHVFLGNHDERPWELLEDNRDAVRLCAEHCVGSMKKVAKKLSADLIPYSGASGGGVWSPKSYARCGNLVFCHGFSCGLNAAEEHARRARMSCVFVHTHREEVRPARMLGDVYGYNIGWAGDIKNTWYASRRPQTLTWRQAYAWGEYGEDWHTINIHREPVTEAQWTIPEATPRTLTRS